MEVDTEFHPFPLKPALELVVASKTEAFLRISRSICTNAKLNRLFKSRAN